MTLGCQWQDSDPLPNLKLELGTPDTVPRFQGGAGVGGDVIPCRTPCQGTEIHR